MRSALKIAFWISLIAIVLIAWDKLFIRIVFGFVCGWYAANWVFQFTCLIISLLLGLRIKSFVLGPVQFDCTGRQMRVIGRGKLLGAGGITFDSSQKSPSDALVAFNRTLLSGQIVLVVLSVGILAWEWGFFGNPPSSEAAPVGAALFAAFGAFTFASIAPVETLPGHFYSRLRAGGPKALNYVRTNHLELMAQRPWRPREWPKEIPEAAYSLLVEPRANVLPETLVGAAIILYAYLADWGETDQALAWLEWVNSNVPRAKSPYARDPMDGVVATRACHYALWKNDPNRAEEILSLVSRKPWVRERTEWLMPTAVIQLASGDSQEAHKTVKKARERLEPLIGRVGSVQMELEWLDIIEQRIKDVSAPAVLPSPAD